MFITEWIFSPVFDAASAAASAFVLSGSVCISTPSKPTSRAILKRSAIGRSFGSIEMRTDFFGDPAAFTSAGVKHAAASGASAVVFKNARRSIDSDTLLSTPDGVANFREQHF